MTPKCENCGAPVTLVPDGDPRYEPPRPAPAPPQDGVREAMRNALGCIESSCDEPECSAAEDLRALLDAPRETPRGSQERLRALDLACETLIANGIGGFCTPKELRDHFINRALQGEGGE